ncbi:hypothetical protein Ndes2437B_g06022 [Nannochloris sp. 'desiccata']|nr:hypothetical protein KSW81_007977 [Chlorella desiccata (nom. nud.)]
MRSSKITLPRASSPLIILFLLMTFSSSVSAIYKDQAGKYDWHKQNIGDVKFARFLDDNIVVASKNGVVASLRNGNGSVTWRVVLDDAEQITALEATADVAVVLTTLSYVRAFGPSGQMLWELYLPAMATDDGNSKGGCFSGQANMSLVTDTAGKDKVLVSCDNTVTCYTLKTGVSCSTEGTPSKTSSTAAAAINGKIVAKVVEAGLQITFPDGREIMDPSLKIKTVDGEILDVAGAFVGPSSGQALVQLQEGTLAYFILDSSSVDGSAAAWVRYEALASTVDFLFAELPAPTPENEAQWAAQQPSTSEALQMQLVALKAQVGLATPPETAAIERYRALTSDRLRPTRDPDGFRRQLVVTTATGKVLALHTGDGRVLWSLDFGAAAAPHRLASWRTPHDVLHDALIAAFRPVGKDLIITVINTHTGKVENEETIEDGAVEGAEVVPLGISYHEDSADQQVYAIIIPSSSASQISVVPRTEGARTAFAQQAQHLVRWRIVKGSSIISGVGFDSTGKERLVWTVDAAPKESGMSILAVAARDPEESVYSAARPIPGGGIMLKHLSPNTLLVVAGKASSSSQNSRIIASVLDAVTGKVLFSQVHTGAAGPVHGIVSENWAAYHYWNVEMERWQIAVLDGYHPAPADLSVLDLALNRPAAANATATSVSTTPPTFERQVFTTRLAVSTLGVTKTAHGTAAKMVLIGTTGGQVYMLDRRMLDPRRPFVPAGTKPTPAQLAENLPPYHPELAVAGPMFATMDRRVARLNKIATVPAVLESASLLVAVGLDVFYSRLQPSRGFDMVPDDFPHALLVAMVGGMAVALVALKAVLQQRALKLKWD